MAFLIEIFCHVKTKRDPYDILTTAINTLVFFFLIKPFPTPVNSLWTPLDSFYEAFLDYSWANMCFQTHYVFQAIVYASISSSRLGAP